MNVSIKRATAEESDLVTELVIELLTEIMDATGEPQFNVDEATIRVQARSFLAGDSYVVLLASNVEDFARKWGQAYLLISMVDIFSVMGLVLGYCIDISTIAEGGAHHSLSRLRLSFQYADSRWRHHDYNRLPHP